MERLTEYHSGVAVIKDKRRHKEAMERLAEYENTGLTPEEIMDGKLLTGWIPVSERMPDENIQVLAQWEYISRVDNTVIVYTEIMHWNGDTWMSYKGVPVGVTVAWMPLPEPYKPCN